MSIYEVAVTTIDGRATTLEEYRGNVLLVVNVASRCAFTGQYAGLEALYQTYRHRGFVILGFPCDQFGHQEPGDEAAIQQFCSTRYSVSFPMFAKVEVNGTNAHPLYRFLKAEKRGWFGTQRIKWNFTKFLVGRTGRVAGRFGPMTRPAKLAKRIEALLAET